MKRTRRQYLAATALSVGLAGCFRVDGVEYPDEIDKDTKPPVESPTNETDGNGDKISIPNPGLTEATKSVVSDSLWFASEYEDAIETYLEVTNTVLTEIAKIREQINEPNDPSTEMANHLESTGYAAGKQAAEALEPHFYPESLLRERTDTHIPALIRSARRSDADRFVEELDRMAGSFSRIRTPLYVSGTFSRDPIHNRLLERLVPRNFETVLVELAIPDRRGFATFAYEPYGDEEVGPTFTEEPISENRQQELRNRLGPVVQSTGRDEELFFSFSTRPNPADQKSEAFNGPPTNLNGTAVYIQKYDNTQIANDRLTTVLETGSTEGRVSIHPTDDTDGRRNWHRFYHDEAGSDRTDLNKFSGVQYGYIIQAGEFLLATGFSGDAWEERPKWQGELINSWILA